MRLVSWLCVAFGCASPASPPATEEPTSPIECPQPTVAATVSARIDDALVRYSTEQGVLGASAAVAANGGTWIGTSGLADLDGVAVTSCDRFRIYSMTKVYTAVIVLLLVEDGMLSLDDPVATWYPKLPDASSITVRQLLSHTSGLFDYLGDREVWSDRHLAWDHDALIDEVAGHPLSFSPGSAFEYSNSNYLVLGRVIERVTRATYREQLRTRILDRFALAETFLEGEEPVPGGFVGGSTREPGGLVAFGFVHHSLAWAAGSLVAPASDVVAFGQLLFDGAILKPASLTAMTTAVVLSTGERSRYGLGLAVLDSTAGPYFGHGGGGACCDFSSWVGFLPERRLIVTALLSTGNISAFQLVTDLVLAAGDL